MLKPDSGIAVAGDRFLREIQTVAQLHHPHILPLYDSGKAGDHLFYVMPYVEGESLRQRLERSGPLPLDEAIRIAREVADALAFAHERGVVHRDVKPENILLSSGHAVVADFGIARAADAAGLTLTDSGLAVGTPAYMSPEQATGDPKVDGRSDQYALGCVVYEMLAGNPPFYGATSQAIMARHATDPVPPLVTVREVSPTIESAIRKALAKVPADRFETTRAFAEALSRSVVEPSNAPTERRPRSLRATIVVAAAVVVAAVLTVAWFGRPTSSAESLQSVAVLPVTTSSDTASMTLADGITEGLHTRLVQVSGLGVLSPGRVEAYRGRATDPQQVGRALGVSAVVSGSLRRAGNRFRVTAQLTDVKTGRSVSHQFDGELIVDGHLQDIFTIQDEITARIVAALRPQLPPSDRASLARGVRTRNVEAYELYLQSKQIPLTFANAERAISLLRRAIQKDSTYADAYAELALWQFLLYGNPGNRPADVAIAIREAVERAIELDPQNARAIGNRGLLKLLYDWNFAGGLEDLRNAVRLNPADIDLVIIHSVYQGLLGRTDSSLVYARRATRIDPLNAFPWNNLGKVFAFAGMRDSAIWASERALVLDSTMWHTNFVLMHSYLDAGRRADADRAVDALLRHGGFEPGPMGMAAIYYARSHNRDGAQAMFRRVSEFAKTRYVPPTAIAAVRLGVGDRAGALSAIEEAARDHDLDLIQDLVFSYAPLNGDPRFEAVRKRVYGNWPMPRNPYPF